LSGYGSITQRSARAAPTATVESVTKGLLACVTFRGNPENIPLVVKSLVKGRRLKRSDDAEKRNQSVPSISLWSVVSAS